jgi:hypothetical protein
MKATDPGRLGDGGRLEAAATELERERRRTRDELEALRGFEDRVRGIDTEAALSATRRAVVAPTAASTATDGLGAVREAYEATVMSVPHYVEEYDDTYGESLAEEFSPEIAAALVGGASFDEHRKGALLSAVSESQTARERLLTVLAAEGGSLAEATETLDAVADELVEFAERSFRGAPFGALDGYRARLGVLEGKCEAVLADRQEAVFEQRRTRWLPSEAPDIARYVYQDLAVDYPVMSVVADRLGDIERIRARIERAMTRCRA